MGTTRSMIEELRIKCTMLFAKNLVLRKMRKNDFIQNCFKPEFDISRVNYGAIGRGK